MNRVVPFLVAVASVSLAASDWPHWRGPSGTGVAASSPLPSTWSATENVAWQADLAGSGVSSPIVSGTRVFVTSQAGDGRRRDGRHPTLTQQGDPAAAGERTLSRRVQRDGVVFMLWGSYAQRKGAVIDAHRHCVLKAPHPSPLSAHRGFFGCGHFAAANEYLRSRGQTPIDWRLPELP